jgi:hypothetical protein
MKKLYEVLLNHAYALVLILCTSTYAPPWVQKKNGNEEAVAYCFAILAMSIVIFAFTFWWAKSGWLSRRPARLAMLCFAALLGLMISVSALAGIYGVLTPDIYFWWRGLPAAILVAIVSIFLFVDVVLGEI